MGVRRGMEVEEVEKRSAENNAEEEGMRRGRKGWR